jgi:hypothetical protein
MRLQAALFLLLGVAAALPCAYTPDPPTALRSGGDILSFPLPPSASLADCAALCCQTTTCVALSFNSPQPEATSVGGMTCAAGSVCCMLKSTIPPLNASNPWPGAVTTAVLAEARGPAPAPPFPASTAIIGAVVGANRTVWRGEPGAGDTWPTALTASGRTFAFVCDTKLGPMGLTELQGDAFLGALNVTVVAPDPLNWLQLCAPYNASRVEDFGNVKPGGIAEVGGVLVVGAACISYGADVGDDALFVRQRNIAGFVAMSEDAGLTWANATPVGAFPGRFAAPVFTSCGRGAPCPDPDSSLQWTYVFFTGSSFGDASYWENGDAHFLARVSPTPADIANPAAYQYYAGAGGGASPRAQWTPDAAQAQPVLTFGRMLGQNSLHYNSQLGRWLCANYGFVSDSGQPTPWHQLPWHTPNTPRRTQLVLLEAPQPWGPWSIFYREDDFGAPWMSQGAYGTTFPAAWHAPLQADGTAAMVMLFSCGNGGVGCEYKLNYVNVTLQLSPEGVAHAQGAQLRSTAL